ncbi:hypothetical protein Q9189_007778 [Teloschistes chrysophthalmus]
MDDVAFSFILNTIVKNAKAVKAFGQIRGMPKVHVRGSDPITIGQVLSNKVAQNMTWFSECVEHVKALRTQANLHYEVRVKRYVSRLDHWEAAKAIYSQAMSLLGRYDNNLRHKDIFDDEPDDSELYREQLLTLLAETAHYKATQPVVWIFRREKVEEMVGTLPVTWPNAGDSDERPHCHARG